MAAVSSKQVYSRVEAKRLLRITERQLQSWERQGLLPAARQKFGFTELLAVRTLIKLRKDKIPPATVRKAVLALRERVRHVADPLTELRIYAEGSKIRVEIEGSTIEPVTGQLLLNFGAAELKRLLAFPDRSKDQAASEGLRRRAEAELLFEKGLEMEQTGAPTNEIIEMYKYAIMLDPDSTGALVNLGTIHFNMRDLAKAEHYYRRALEADSKYALAHFNIGNLYDERGDREKALEHYLAALGLNPHYADAHYNIALLYQTLGETLKAIQHWKTYLRIDPSSSWAAIARRELDKIRASMMVQGGA